MEKEILTRTRAANGDQTCEQFEAAIAEELVQRGLTMRGLEIAREWLAQRYGNNQYSRCKRLATLRACAWNIANS